MVSAPALTNAPEWTVSELSGRLKRTLEDAFGHVRLRGEISGYRGPHASGHAYFCLKDRDARLDAVVWKTTFTRMKFRPQEGLEVVAVGRITTFPGKSTYQIVVESLEPAGIGALMALLDERRRTLAAEGLFATERKRRPPFLPTVIGVITSPTGAVIRDILHRLEDRFARRVLLWPVRVQGETCAAEVAAAIAGLNAIEPGGTVPRPDVIIVARGGGSLEDLWGFNDEAVVRAAAASRIPLISAVGHETDWTLLDHAADLRAPTPTGAAEMAVPVRSELVAQVAALTGRQIGGLRRGLEVRRTELRSAARALPSAEALVGSKRQRLDHAGARLAPALLQNARDHERLLQIAAGKLARQRPDVKLVELRTRLGGALHKPATAMLAAMRTRRERFEDVGGRLRIGLEVALRAERIRIEGCRQRVSSVSDAMARAARTGVERSDGRVQALSGLLVSLSYRSVLDRGYALVRGADDRPIFRAASLAAGQPISIEFADGIQRAQAGAVRSKRRAVPLVQASLFDM